MVQQAARRLIEAEARLQALGSRAPTDVVRRARAAVAQRRVEFRKAKKRLADERVVNR